MKRFFAYLVFALTLSLVLSACGDAMERGNVTASPWPEVTAPATPYPTAVISASPLPDLSMERDTPDQDFGTDDEKGPADHTGTAAGTSSPIPTDSTR